jgi:hypothetical protein
MQTTERRKIETHAIGHTTCAHILRAGNDPARWELACEAPKSGLSRRIPYKLDVCVLDFGFHQW